jgi:hypothetical protein
MKKILGELIFWFLEMDFFTESERQILSLSLSLSLSLPLSMYLKVIKIRIVYYRFVNKSFKKKSSLTYISRNTAVSISLCVYYQVLACVVCLSVLSLSASTSVCVCLL